MVDGRKVFDASFAAAFFTGYHAGAGDAAALAHTYQFRTFYAVAVNGTACSEALLYAGLAGNFGVPVALISGDRMRSSGDAAPSVGRRRRRQGSIGHYGGRFADAARSASRHPRGCARGRRRIDEGQTLSFRPPYEW